MRYLLLSAMFALSACNTWNGARDDLAAGYQGAKRSGEESQSRNAARTPLDWGDDTPHHQAGRQ